MKYSSKLSASAAEKALKALLIARDMEFPRTRSIGTLIDIIEKSGIELPKDLQQVRKLTYFAVEGRYPIPDDFSPIITTSEFEFYLSIVENLLVWIGELVENET